MKIHDARIIALDAVERGWIDPQDVWTVASRWMNAGTTAKAEQIFAGILSLAQVEELVDARSEQATQNIPNQAIPPGPMSMPAPPGQFVGPRYTLRDHLGVGGVGTVVAATDREIRRVVALKTLKDDDADAESVRRFVEEARITGQLEHPNIIPVYDLGAAPDGKPFYTMRVVEQRSLRDVLRGRKRDEWPLARLLGVLVQVCRALAYAHSRGVLHRDIKPENILLGDFGEVYLADWGLALLRETGQSKAELELHSDDSAPPPSLTQMGGTPGYMAPEAIGETLKVDHRADLYAIGIMLYEILAGRLPFTGKSSAEILMNCFEGKMTPLRELAPHAPLLLQDLTARLLENDREKRMGSAKEVAERIEEFLEGAKETERRKEEARALCAQAAEPTARHRQLEAQRVKLTAQASALMKNVKSWEPLDKKRPAWRMEDLASKADRESALALADAIELYQKALGYDPDCTLAHESLAQIYWDRARNAEEQRREATKLYFEALVTEHDTQKKFAEIMRAEGLLSIASKPAGAHVYIQRFFDRDRTLVPAEERYLGKAPVDSARLEPGSYLVTLKHPGFRDVRYPVLITRGGHHRAEVNLYTEAEIGEGFVYVPGSVAILGGDADGVDSLPRQELYVPDFAIAQFPVTFREYCTFLDELERGDPKLAEKRAPHDMRGSEGMVVQKREGKWEPLPHMIEGEARKMFPPEQGHLWQVPIHLVDWFDARAYAQWRGGSAGGLRLPTEAEWEKSARGVDGRIFPWGDTFDATFCKMRDSRPFQCQPEPLGTFPSDESPYGVRELAGGIRQWVLDLLGEQSMDETLRKTEPPANMDRGESPWRRVRGGAWNVEPKWVRAASRSRVSSLTRGTALGFRLAKELRRG